MSDLEQKAVELLTRFETLAEQTTPEVIDAALTAVRISAFGHLTTASVIAGASGTIAALSYQVVRKQLALDSYEQSDGKIIASCVALVFSLVPFGVAVADLTNVWHWVAMFEPKLALAHKLLGL